MQSFEFSEGVRLYEKVDSISFSIGLGAGAGRLQ